ncbi:zinc ribbon domain-containing protein [Gilvimarinus sp. SDUM040013]|uniref:Zinc ribbon domain-containing protein n=1 Tax=Gilvimarinus gilvus TaxID=3058038 RepID=A0ABU4S737_9GAMM|nr:zinc ribbon domain-containing protein [Gilvimarinus sp. SDUM040013]MDO3384913.1 zinc ribbon domain-containing protein [Gilvimarinus sp. SDUM040013]MDX6851454.1 zinc ribbon domain-containing protein [Gilvimarinus sp. SDUM040013]
MRDRPDFDSYSLEELFDALNSINGEKYPENIKAVKKAIADKQMGQSYSCPKCGCEGYEPGYLHAAGSGLHAVIDVETERYITVSCMDCGYTDIYKRKVGEGQKLLDFLF